MYRKKYHIHFVGIGGIGMSGIAELLINLGYKVSGSDRKPPISRDDSTAWAAESLGHSEHQVEGADVVVISTAIGAENPEVTAAKRALHSRYSPRLKCWPN